MNIVRYNTFRDLRNLQDEMTRLFTGVAPASVDRDDALSGAWNPSVDISENKENLVLEAELPGMNREDFDLSIEHNVITLRGERRFEKKEDTDNYHRVERAYGNFTRSFTLPNTITGEGVSADYRNGVLRVTIPKREETKARRIEVKGEGEAPKTIEAKANAAKS